MDQPPRPVSSTAQGEPGPLPPTPARRPLRLRAHGFAGSLHARVLAGFLVLALVPLGALSLLGQRAMRGSLTEAAYMSLSASALRTAVSFDAFIDMNRKILATEAKLPSLGDYLRRAGKEGAAGPDAEAVRRVLASFAQRDQVFIASYALLDGSGKNLLDTSATREESESQHRYFEHTLEYDEAYASSVEILASDGQAYIYFSSPVHDGSGAPIGVLRARYSAAVLQSMITESRGSVGADSFAVLFDEEHRVLAQGIGNASSSALLDARREPSSAPGASSEQQFSDPCLLAGLETKGRDALHFTCNFTTYAQEEMAFAVARLGAAPWIAAFFVPQKAFLSPVEAQSRSLLYVALAVLAAAALVATVAARKVSRPVMRLTTSARAIAEGNLSASIEVGSGGQIGVLESAFRRMAEEIRRLVEDLARQNRELEAANDRLQQQNVKLAEEIEERARNEARVREQQEAIRALSTPIIAVWEGVLALPVIGAVDEARAVQMMEQLLAEIARARARVAILDLTGVERLDAQALGYLLSIVRATRLLGSRCVLSGISPEVASSIVDLGAGDIGARSFVKLRDALRYSVELAKSPGASGRRSPSTR